MKSSIICVIMILVTRDIKDNELSQLEINIIDSFAIWINQHVHKQVRKNLIFFSQLSSQLQQSC